MIDEQELPSGLHHVNNDELQDEASLTRFPMKLMGLYLGISFVWILTSDRIVSALFPDSSTESWVQTSKGIAYVVVTAAVMNAVVSSYMKKVQASRRELEDAWDETILGWALAMDARESHLALHSQRVADLTVALARHMNLPESKLRMIYRGALLHDIGKLGVPEAVLSQPGKLTDEQWTLMKTHPDNAVKMLTPIKFLRPAMDIPQSHHEKWDGTGYPQGLAQLQIPPMARIFAVVDVYDALTSYRTYHDSLSHEDAMRVIHEESGTHFDPEVVKQFEELMLATDRSVFS
ncbi:MAG: HD-GYP domain-containing protein [Candidatus Nanopelagicales bacterium]